MEWYYILMILAGGEIFAILLFWLLSKVFHGREGAKISRRSIIKGIVERMFIFFSLIYNLPHALTVLGALKIATRIKDENRISNDYFLIGNLLSISLAIAYFIVWKDVLK